MLMVSVDNNNPVNKDRTIVDVINFSLYSYDFISKFKGHKRTVEYTADDHNGFNAVVHREPLIHKVAAVATPVIHKVAAPVHYAEPHYAHAPIHHHY